MRTFRIAALAALCAFALVGCGGESPPASAPAQPPAGSGAPGGMGGGPADMAPGPASGAGTVTMKYDEADLKALEAKLAKTPDNPELKKETAEASFEVGYAMMMNPELSSRVKYPGALRLFRQAIKLDPKHQRAIENRDQIEGIYASMGRPIPK